MKNIIKRDGSVVAFEADKIENAIAKAFISTSEIPARDISAMARAVELIVEAELNTKSKDSATVEEIQDVVEKTLMKVGYQNTAKAYILYRNQHEKVRQAEKTRIDYQKLVEFLKGYR